MPIAIKSEKLRISSEKKTEELAKKFTKKLKPGHVVFIYGEIGVGKTTFVRYLINQFQKINKSNVTEVLSPTFNLLNEYEIGQVIIRHYDLFRLKKKDEIKNLDIFDDVSKNITLKEWPQLINQRPKNLVELSFEYGKKDKDRLVKIIGLDIKI